MVAVKRIFSLLAAICYILFFIVLIAVTPMLLGYKPAVVLTGSMEPNYPVGCVAYYKATDYQDIQVGDVITFHSSMTTDGGLVTHRVTSVDDENMTFRTKGDANGSEDVSPVSYSNVEGKVHSKKIPYVGYLIGTLKSNPLIVIVMLLVIAMSAVMDRVAEANERKGAKHAKS